MDLRLRNLEQLDARAVPLPHGTEVVTRVDRIVSERPVPQGSVGRVTKVDGEQLDLPSVRGHEGLEYDNRALQFVDEATHSRR